MQTIETKTLQPTDNRGAQIKATHTGGLETITMPLNYGKDCKVNHQDAARQLMHKLKWDGEMHGGSTKTGMAWVFVSEDSLMIKGKFTETEIPSGPWSTQDDYI
tara:strand:- start:33 stop:344 length:312 start_codon:yes stop_codon:yes gene_type:complete